MKILSRNYSSKLQYVSQSLKFFPISLNLPEIFRNLYSTTICIFFHSSKFAERSHEPFSLPFSLVPIYRSGVYHFKEGRGDSFDRAGRYTGGIVGECEEPSGDRWQEQRDPTRNGNVAEESLSAFEQNAGERRAIRLLERRRGQEQQGSCRLVQGWSNEERQVELKKKKTKKIKKDTKQKKKRNVAHEGRRSWIVPRR